MSESQIVKLERLLYEAEKRLSSFQREGSHLHTLLKETRDEIISQHQVLNTLLNNANVSDKEILLQRTETDNRALQIELSILTKKLEDLQEINNSLVVKINELNRATIGSKRQIDDALETELRSEGSKIGRQNSTDQKYDNLQKIAHEMEMRLIQEQKNNKKLQETIDKLKGDISQAGIIKLIQENEKLSVEMKRLRELTDYQKKQLIEKEVPDEQNVPVQKRVNYEEKIKSLLQLVSDMEKNLAEEQSNNRVLKHNVDRLNSDLKHYKLNIILESDSNEKNFERKLNELQEALEIANKDIMEERNTNQGLVESIIELNKSVQYYKEQYKQIYNNNQNINNTDLNAALEQSNKLLSEIFSENVIQEQDNFEEERYTNTSIANSVAAQQSTRWNIDDLTNDTTDSVISSSVDWTKTWLAKNHDGRLISNIGIVQSKRGKLAKEVQTKSREKSKNRKASTRTKAISSSQNNNKQKLKLVSRKDKFCKCSKSQVVSYNARVKDYEMNLKNVKYNLDRFKQMVVSNGNSGL